MIRAIVTDIEGTTTSVSFVYDVLFPFARERLHEFVDRHRADPQVRAQLDAVSDQVGRPLTDEEAVAQLAAWIDEDRKSTPLKALQGMIWRAGYRDGDFTGHVYDDAARKLRDWHRSGKRLYVYSSGSVAAQQLLFGHSDHGDLTPLFEGYFDTRTGNKREEASYRRIVDAIGLPAEEILFLSDTVAELDAAAAAGMVTCRLVREAVPGARARHQEVGDFDAVALE